jgi:ADP-heptose:LPS heptosyltransferase
MHLIDQQLNLMLRGRFEEGWKLSEEMEQTIPNDLRHKFNRGWFLINRGRFQEGYQSLEAGRFLNVYGAKRLPTNKPIWNQESLIDKTVIINMEAGYGDQMMTVRFAKEIKDRGGKCVLCCDITTHGLFSRVEGVAACITIDQVSSTHHDFWIPSFSCSWLFGHTFENIPNQPYLTANPLSVPIWKSILKTTDKPKIGIRWSGSPQFEHQQFRIFPPEKLINLSKHSELEFYSLQKDSDTMELPDSVSDLQHLLLSWDDTAACIQNLDLVITSCTSIAHLASAMGKPTWVIVPILPYHIWAYGGDHSPWYQNTTRVFRQENFGNWDKPFANLEQHMLQYFNLEEK